MNQGSKYKIFVINLRRSKERWHYIAQQLDALHLPYERIEAVDGKSLTASEVERVFDAAKARRYYHYDLTKGEIACYLSHQKAWQRIIDDGVSFGVVLEDDVNIAAHLPQILEQLSTVSLPWSLVKLAAPFKSQRFRVLQSFATAKLVFYTRKPPMGAAGYAISRAGAAQLLRQRERIFRPVDVDMQWLYELNIQCLGIVPYAIDNTHQHGSDILSVEPRASVQRRPINRVRHQVGLLIDNLKARARDRRLFNRRDIFGG